MDAFEIVRKAFLYATVAACLAGTAGSPLAAQASNQNEEVQMGQEVFNELKAKGEIVESSSPLRRVETNCGRHYAIGAAPIQPSVKVLSGS